MKASKGFTLMELLVVISIIALLLSILMPSLAKVKQQAKTVVCKANIRQLGLAFTFYADANKDSFPPGFQKLDADRDGCWNFILEPYYEEKALLFCPAATKTAEEGGTNPFVAWQFYNNTNGDIHEGSYGSNKYVNNCPPDWLWQSGALTSLNWRKTTISNAYNVPLLLDSWWVTAAPEEKDAPPEYAGFQDTTGKNGMNQFCISRHGTKANCIFVDFSIRDVKLQELWELKWHKRWDTEGWRGEWPNWLK